MITFSVPMMSVNVDDELQFSHSVNTESGHIIKREFWEEQPNMDYVEYYPTNNKISKCLNNYIMLSGKIKVSYTWNEEDNITQEDITQYKNLMSELNPEDSYANWEEGDNSIAWTLEYPACVKEWRERSLAWELKTQGASIEILEDETELLCVLQHSFGWAYKNVDLNPEEQIETEKNSYKCYLFFGNKCEVTSVNNMYPVTVEKYEVIELTNEKCVVRNISNKPCKVVMLCK